MTTREVLEAAARRIKRRGFIQGLDGFTKPKGPYCALGAIRHLQAPEYLRQRASMRLDLYLTRKFGAVSPAQWNDTKGRTAQQVIAALMDAAVARGLT